MDNSALATLMSNDALHVEEAVFIILELFIIPIEFALALVLLEREIGIGSLLPFLVAILAFAASFAIRHASRSNRSDLMKGFRSELDLPQMSSPI
jgi:hypothetical protein